MRYRLQLSWLLLLAVVSTTGCASSPLRPFKWLRHRSAQSHVGQSADEDAQAMTVETLSAAPPKLPPGIELPPEPEAKTETQPSGATQPPNTGSRGVIFASSQSD